MTTPEQIETVTQHYIHAAIWADKEEGTFPECDDKQQETARQACTKFIEQCEAAGGLFTKAMARYEHGYGRHPDAGSAEAAFGHDFWLTRQGHGVGFWDRNELGEELGRALTDEARKVGECYHYQTPDGWFCFDE